MGYQEKMNEALAIVAAHNTANPQATIDPADFAAKAKAPPYEWHDEDDLAHVTADEIVALSGGKLPAVKVRRILTAWKGTTSPAQPTFPKPLPGTPRVALPEDLIDVEIEAG